MYPLPFTTPPLSIGWSKRSKRPSLELTAARREKEPEAWRKWVVEIPLAYPDVDEAGDDGEDFQNIHLYVVK